MRVFLINLDAEKLRLAEADAQLRRNDVAYERVAAVWGKDLSQEARDAAVNRFRWWCAIGRPVRVGEIGCAMSHYKIYRRITDEKMPFACVLEDDVILDERFPTVLKTVESFVDPSRPQVVLLSNHTAFESSTPCILSAETDMYAEGYVITALAAKALSSVNWPMQTPCDHWGRWVKRGVIELYHAFPTVCSQDQKHYTSGTVDAGCFDVSKLSFPRWFFHKCCRLAGKAIDRILPL